MIALTLNKMSKATVKLKNPARMDLKSRRSVSRFVMFEKLAKSNSTRLPCLIPKDLSLTKRINKRRDERFWGGQAKGVSSPQMGWGVTTDGCRWLKIEYK